MKLHSLIPTLRLACSVALANQEANKLNDNSALAIMFLADDTPEIIYVPDTREFKCLPQYVYAAVLIGKSLGDITVTISNLEMPHEQSVERMASILLTGISKLIYETKLCDHRMIEVAGKLDQFALNGIAAGINASSKAAQKISSLQPCDSPERN